MSTPSTDEYVEAFLTALRAPLKQRTTFTPAGRAVIRSSGEKLIFGPDGKPIKVVEDENGGTQIETDDRLHAVVRPATVRSRATTKG